MVAYICTEETITIILDGTSRCIKIKSKAHRNEIVIALEKFKKSAQTETEKKFLMDILTPINRCILKSDGRFEMDADEKKLYLTGSKDPIPSQLADKIIDFLDNGLPVTPLIKFWESCLKNPHFIAVQELFDFLERNKLPITDDGGFLGYKKLNFAERVVIPEKFEELLLNKQGEVVTVKGFKVSDAVSKEYLDFISAVNNPMMKDVHSGRIKQKLGDVVSIPRIKLNELERRESCGYGLHIGSFDYEFSGNVRVLCKVMPEDVIACNPHEEKLRTCKYQIVSFVDERKEIAEMLINLTNEEKTIAAGVHMINHDEDIEPMFKPEDIVQCVFAPDRDLSVGRYYYVIDTDEEDVLVIDERGVEEWYDQSCFTAKV